MSETTQQQQMELEVTHHTFRVKGGSADATAALKAYIERAFGKPEVKGDPSDGTTKRSNQPGKGKGNTPRRNGPRAPAKPKAKGDAGSGGGAVEQEKPSGEKS